MAAPELAERSLAGCGYGVQHRGKSNAGARWRPVPTIASSGKIITKKRKKPNKNTLNVTYFTGIVRFV